jgi:hypothetical protein
MGLAGGDAVKGGRSRPENMDILQGKAMRGGNDGVKSNADGLGGKKGRTWVTESLNVGGEGGSEAGRQGSGEEKG